MRNLRIEVRQVQSDDSQQSGLEVAAPGGPTVQLKQSSSSANAVQQALVLNGRATRLGLQTSTPVRLFQTFVRNGTVVLTQGTVLLEAGTGFTALPRWDGGTLVELELSAQQVLRPSATPNGASATSTASSTVLVPLDEWATVGQSEEMFDTNRRGLTGARQQSSQTHTEVQVRVTVR